MTPIARDGLPARAGGPWTQEKLGYLRKYASAFMVAMAKKPWDRLVYVDLLAGPGMDMNEETGQEFEGSPLIALETRPAFHQLYLGDAKSKNVSALRQRISPADLTSRVDLDTGDCHTRVQKIIKTLTRGTLGLAFVDPEGFEVKFDFFRWLARGQLDVLFLFPTGGATRNLRLFAVSEKSPLDALVEGWRNLPIAKLAAGKLLSSAEEKQLQRSLLGEFRTRMAALGFTHYDRDDPAMLNSKRAIMYHLLFFSKHTVGLKIWKGIKKIGPDQQRTLDLYPED